LVPREFTSRWKVTKSSVANPLIPVRVGGGFLHLEEFLRINVPIELEKMAQRDPINVLSKNIGKESSKNQLSTASSQAEQ
jgi:hypothetical protein